ncbi:MAG: glycosyltransferase family 4 protein [Muribaculaceae bacterium]|nr:glycosyltransferase family 4 protein [Muribaculaceae bacterium]
MKILFIFHNTSLAGGANLSGMSLIRGLRARGHEILAVCNDAAGELTCRLREEGFATTVAPYHVAWPARPVGLRQWLIYPPKALKYRIDNLKATRTLSEIAGKFRPDIIHSNSSVIDIGSRVSRRLYVPHVMHFREYGFRDTDCVMWHIPNILKHPLQYNIAVSKDIRRFRSLDLRGHCRTIYNGVLADGSVRINDNPDRYLLYAGQITQAKGVEDLLRAYAMLPAERRGQYPLLMAGSTGNTEYLQYIRELTGSLGIASDVRMLGHVGNVPDLMYAATALIVPSHNEAFGRIIPEAMANGCLVVGRDTAGIREQLDNGLEATGREIGIRYSDPARLTGILSDITSGDISRYAGMRRSAADAVSRLYTHDSYVDAVESYYKSILQ